MSRKLVRSMLRAEANAKGIKASAFVNHRFRERQEKRYGHEIAEVLVFIGSGKGKTRRRAARKILPTLAVKGGK